MVSIRYLDSPGQIPLSSVYQTFKLLKNEYDDCCFRKNNILMGTMAPNTIVEIIA
jgi:hypothetical protein